MPNFNVTTLQGSTHAVPNAEYYKREDGWVTFKDSDHKVIADFQESQLQFIAKVALGNGGAE